MKNLIEKAMQNEKFVSKISKNVIQYAFFLSIYQFSKDGHDFNELPWFRSSKRK